MLPFYKLHRVVCCNMVLNNAVRLAVVCTIFILKEDVIGYICEQNIWVEHMISKEYNIRLRNNRLSIQITNDNGFDSICLTGFIRRVVYICASTSTPLVRIEFSFVKFNFGCRSRWAKRRQPRSMVWSHRLKFLYWNAIGLMKKLIAIRLKKFVKFSRIFLYIYREHCGKWKTICTIFKIFK